MAWTSLQKECERSKGSVLALVLFGESCYDWNNKTSKAMLQKAYHLCHRSWKKLVPVIQSAAHEAHGIPTCSTDAFYKFVVQDASDGSDALSTARTGDKGQQSPTATNSQQGKLASLRDGQKSDDHAHSRRSTRKAELVRTTSKPAHESVAVAVDQPAFFSTELPFSKLKPPQDQDPSNSSQDASLDKKPPKRKDVSLERELFLREIALKLELPAECTAKIRRHYACQGSLEGKCSFKLHLQCTAKNCFYYVVEVPEPLRASQTKISYSVRNIRPVRQHSRQKPRRVQGRALEELARAAAASGGATIHSHGLHSACLQNEDHPMFLASQQAIQHALHQTRFPPSIKSFEKNDVASLKRYFEAKGIKFIDTYSGSPFMVTFGSPCQLRLFGQHPERVMHLDATGTVVSSDVGDNSSTRVFLYASCFEPTCPPGKTIMALPVWECLSNSHTTEAISRYLENTRTQLATQWKTLKAPNYNKLPTHVVIDDSWAFIHAVLRTMPLHPTNLVDFLKEKMAYMKAVSKPESGVTSANLGFKLSICKSHMIHSWAKHKSFSGHSGSDASKPQLQKKIILRGCVKLAYAPSLSTAAQTFRQLCLLCLSEHLTPEVEAIRTEFEKGVVPEEKAEKLLQAVEKGKSKRRVDWMSKRTDSESEPEDSEDEEAFSTEKKWAGGDGLPKKQTQTRTGRRQRLRDQSPFFKFFQRIFSAVGEEESTDQKAAPGSKANPYKNTKFLNYFLCQWLVIFPLWNILTAGHVFKDGRVGLLTNGRVERYIRWIKETRLSLHHTLGPVGFLYRHQDLCVKHGDTAQCYLELAKKARKKSTKPKANSSKASKGYDKPLQAKPLHNFFDDPEATDSDAHEDEDHWVDIPGDLETVSNWKSSKLSPSHAASLHAGSLLTPLQNRQGMDTPVIQRMSSETIAAKTSQLPRKVTPAHARTTPVQAEKVVAKDVLRKKNHEPTSASTKRQKSGTFTVTPKSVLVKRQRNRPLSNRRGTTTSRKLLPEEIPFCDTMDFGAAAGGNKLNQQKLSLPSNCSS
jgi:hypothetical protein